MRVGGCLATRFLSQSPFLPIQSVPSLWHSSFSRTIPGYLSTGTLQVMRGREQGQGRNGSGKCPLGTGREETVLSRASNQHRHFLFQVLNIPPLIRILSLDPHSLCLCF